jgi:hypothetical protein
MCDGVCITSYKRQTPAWFAARMARTSRLTLLIFRFDLRIDECRWTLALPMTFNAKVSGVSAFRHSTTVENSPSPSRLSTS